MADAKKAAGNEAMKSGRFSEAVERYTEAIEIDSSNAVFFSNRSAAHLSNGDFSSALADAQKAASLKPDWAKAHARIGAAYQSKRQFSLAAKAYDKAFELGGSKEYEDSAKFNLQESRYVSGLDSRPSTSSPSTSRSGATSTASKTDVYGFWLAAALFFATLLTSSAKFFRATMLTCVFVTASSLLRSYGTPESYSLQALKVYGGRLASDPRTSRLVWVPVFFGLKSNLIALAVLVLPLAFVGLANTRTALPAVIDSKMGPLLTSVWTQGSMGFYRLSGLPNQAEYVALSDADKIRRVEHVLKDASVTLEIALGVSLLASALTGSNSIVSFLLWANVERMRYATDRMVRIKLDAIDSMLMSRMPIVTLPYWSKLKSWLRPAQVVP